MEKEGSTAMVSVSSPNPDALLGFIMRYENRKLPDELPHGITVSIIDVCDGFHMLPLRSRDDEIIMTVKI